ncbi:MAG: PleD family two-component system response regulator [Spirochaetia bacterium]
MQRIIVIDDNDELSGFLKIIIEKAGYDVKTYNNGKRFFGEALNQHFDMIISDVDLPGFSEVEMIEKLMELDVLSKVPVLFLSGTTQRSEIPILAAKGNLLAVDFMEKPPIFEWLLYKIKLLLNYRELSLKLSGTNSLR